MWTHLYREAKLVELQLKQRQRDLAQQRLLADLPRCQPRAVRSAAGTLGAWLAWLFQ
jgi:hypothetical protein